MRLGRRDLLRSAALGAAAVVSGVGRAGATGKPGMTVYKSPTCGCCAAWVEHVRAAGFPITSVDLEELTPIKRKHGVSPALQSCHTALIDGYVVEGHVPADLVERLLRERPKIAGLAVPGMPMGSPGMETPGRAPDRYQVLAFDRSGRTTVFASR